MTQDTHRQQGNHWSILTAALSLACMLAMLMGPMPRTSASSDQLTTEDKRMLAKGELVTKQKNEQRGTYKLIGGQSWQIVDVPFDTAWEVLKDRSGYKNFIPLATETNVSQLNDQEADVAVRQQWGPIDLHYVLQTTVENESGAVVFRVDHSKDHDIRAGWGFIRARPYKNDRTLVSFGALVDIGDGVFVSVIRPAVRKNLLRIPYFFKRHVEGDQVAAQATP